MHLDACHHVSFQVFSPSVSSSVFTCGAKLSRSRSTFKSQDTSRTSPQAAYHLRRAACHHADTDTRAGEYVLELSDCLLTAADSDQHIRYLKYNIQRFQLSHFKRYKCTYIH